MDFNDRESVWIYAGEVDPELDSLLCHRNGFGENVCENDIRSTTVVGNIEGLGRSE